MYITKYFYFIVIFLSDLSRYKTGIRGIFSIIDVMMRGAGGDPLQPNQLFHQKWNLSDNNDICWQAISLLCMLNLKASITKSQIYSAVARKMSHTFDGVTLDSRRLHYCTVRYHLRRHPLPAI